MYKNQVRDCIALGEYKCHNWLIRKGLYGPRGYVLLTDAEKNRIIGSHGNEDADWLVEHHIKMHGGCTYVGNLGLKLGTWIGFDTSHYYSGQSVKNKAFVQKECLQIIDQLNTKKRPTDSSKANGQIEHPH